MGSDLIPVLTAIPLLLPTVSTTYISLNVWYINLDTTLANPLRTRPPTEAQKHAS